MIIGSDTKRAKLRLVIYRGAHGNRPDHRSATYPVAEGETILSGQLISVRRNTLTGENEWVRGHDAALDQANSFYIADGDYVVTEYGVSDRDAHAAGNLKGLSVHGDYELGTARYKAGESYVAGDELTYDGTTGDLKKASTTGNIVIGVVTHDFAAPVDFSSAYVPAVDAAGLVSDGVKGGSFTIGRHSNAIDLTRVRFETNAPYKKPA